jgi:hypothetical protein
MWRYFVLRPDGEWMLFTKGTLEECLDDLFYHRTHTCDYHGHRLEVGVSDG